jgi:hypothetical protein
MVLAAWLIAWKNRRSQGRAVGFLGAVHLVGEKVGKQDVYTKCSSIMHIFINLRLNFVSHFI